MGDRDLGSCCIFAWRERDRVCIVVSEMPAIVLFLFWCVFLCQYELVKATRVSRCRQRVCCAQLTPLQNKSPSIDHLSLLIGKPLLHVPACFSYCGNQFSVLHVAEQSNHVSGCLQGLSLKSFSALLPPLSPRIYHTLWSSVKGRHRRVLPSFFVVLAPPHYTAVCMVTGPGAGIGSVNPTTLSKQIWSKLTVVQIQAGDF